MISIGAVAGDGAAYYASDNYYTADQAAEQSEWIGKGADALGLSGKVDPEIFEQMILGKLPDGSQLDAQRGEHRPGLDLTLSVSKSVSLLAIIGGDKRIVSELKQAVGATLGWIERNLIETKIWDGERQQVERSGNLLAATFLHDVNRNAEPQLHIHAVVLNATKASDGKWHALRNDELFRRQHAISAVFNSELRRRLEGLGYETTPARNPLDGAFELAGVSRKIIEAFSTRSTEIREALDAEGRGSPREREIAALATRKGKEVAPDPAKRAEGWRDLARKVGLDAQRLVRASIQRLERGQSMWGQVVAGIRGIGNRGAALVAAMGLTPRADDPLVPERIGRLEPRAYAAAEAVASASRDLSEREAGFDRIDLLGRALDRMGPISVADVEQRIDLLVAKGLLVGGDRLLTPETAVRLEERILGHLQAARGACIPMMERPEAAARVQEAAQELGLRRLNPGQQKAAVDILSSTNRVHYVQGGAGTGKSASLSPVAQVAREEGRAVHALAIASGTARDFGEKVGVPGQSIASFIARHRGVLDSSASADKLAELRSTLSGSFVMVDEASMIPNQQFEQLLRIASVLGVERLVMAGDVRQLPPVEAGKPFEMTQAKGAPTSHIHENLRAASPLMKEVNAALAENDVGGAFRLLEERTTEVGSQEAASHAAQRWASLDAKSRDRTLLLAPSRAMRSAINAAVQQELRKAGEIGAAASPQTVLERINVTREGARQLRAWAEGNVVEFRTNLPSQSLWRGERGTVIEREGSRVTLRMSDGSIKAISPERLPRNLKHDAVSLYREKQIDLHVGDRIRWTDNNQSRGLLNNQQSTIIAITAETVTVQHADGMEIDLKRDDPALEKLDLAYALTVHASQGMTAQSAILVMREQERHLNSTRSFLVSATRATDNLSLIVDNVQGVEHAVIRNAGNKASALEIADQGCRPGESETDYLKRKLGFEDARPDLSQAGEAKPENAKVDLPERNIERSR